MLEKTKEKNAYQSYAAGYDAETPNGHEYTAYAIGSADSTAGRSKMTETEFYEWILRR